MIGDEEAENGRTINTKDIAVFFQDETRFKNMRVKNFLLFQLRSAITVWEIRVTWAESNWSFLHETDF